MNNTAIIVIIRQFIVRSIYFVPFVLGFLFIHPPFNILAACLLVLKSKLPSESDLYELQVLGKHVALILTRAGNDTDKENFNLMKQTFTFGEEVLHQADVDGGPAKNLVDDIFGIVEAITVVLMIVWYVVQVV